MLDLSKLNVTSPRLVVPWDNCSIFGAQARHWILICWSNAKEVNCTNTNGWTCWLEFLQKEKIYKKK